jgi:aminopeptidase N
VVRRRCGAGPRQDIWLNEGFATYAEWLWAEYEGQATPDESFQATYDAFPADDPFWTVTIGDPGVRDLFSNPVYFRGAMTLHARRQAVGDDAFWTTIREWAAENSGGNVTTEQFIALAEEVSGQQLDDLFTTWLFTPSRPDLTAAASTLGPPLPLTPHRPAMPLPVGSPPPGRAWTGAATERDRYLTQVFPASR